MESKGGDLSLKAVTKWTVNTFIPLGSTGLFLLAFAESSFFPIPPDVLLIALSLAVPKDAFIFAGVTTAGSVCGAAAGYFIGAKGGRPLLRRFVSEERLSKVHRYFQRYGVWAVGIAGFTPIPYKIFTLSSGAFGVNFLRFILISVAARGGRFFLVGGAIYIWGPGIKTLLENYFNAVSLLFVLLLAGGFALFKFMPGRRRTGCEESSH